jgi:hypothetical protein
MVNKNYPDSVIQASNARGFQGLNEKIALQSKMAQEREQFQPEMTSEIALSHQTLSDEMDKLEVEFSELCARLRPVLKLDQPQANCAQADKCESPWWAASQVGKHHLAQAQRVREITGRVQELLGLLAV